MAGSSITEDGSTFTLYPVVPNATTPGTVPFTAGADPDMAIDYEIVKGVSDMLSNAATELNPQILTLKSQVDGLLTQDGGLWMDATSPAITSVYETFNSSAVQVVAAIANFSASFAAFLAQMQSMDQSNANQILNPPATS